MMKTSALINFVQKLSSLQRVVIQAHDYPDHDAIASAYAMSVLLKELGIDSIIVYNGEIDRISLSNMIEWLNIPVSHCSKAQLTTLDKIITIDGCIGERNVTDMPGEEIAVIDHHVVTPPNNLWFSDVREDYGATATILFEYFQAFNINMSKDVATALLVGLKIDTAHMTRGVCSADLKAFVMFNQQADLALVNKICRNEITYSELNLFEHVCQSVKQTEGVGLATVSIDCPKNMLGILGDFLLTVNELDVVVIAQSSQRGIQLSLRSECQYVDVAKVVREQLNIKSFGFGGGHPHMAGGIVFKDYLSEFITEKELHLSPIIDSILALRRSA
ncbi:DHH family phosphoesterase [Shewanella kaireitica]|uniref:DHH family phosphoesterase n=1 Tax=Shewanella kaireitica TaxID=212021 RepID=UPI00200BD7CB|nr:DHH family phosphoesterase [Shewanella kaireitica]MCL1095102.1 DHH family phosphoesterase [Shewanella kaireitica]